jgi:hypothetical protein
MAVWASSLTVIGNLRFGNVDGVGPTTPDR